MRKLKIPRVIFSNKEISLLCRIRSSFNLRRDVLNIFRVTLDNAFPKSFRDSHILFSLFCIVLRLDPDLYTFREAAKNSTNKEDYIYTKYSKYKQNMRGGCIVDCNSIHLFLILG